MDKKHHIVEGEASESDEEELPKKAHNIKKSRPVKTNTNEGTAFDHHRQGTVVSGEASESDEEIDTSDLGTKLHIDSSLPPNYSLHSPGMKDQPTSVSKSEVIIKPKYGTLLHWKLVEKNSDFRKNFCEAIGQVYLTSAKEIKNTTAHSTRAQLAVQDISHTMRLLTNDLFHLEDKLDMIADSKLLPSVKINVSS